MVSAIALRRKAGVAEFNDEFVRSAPVQALMRKVERVLDPEIEAQGWEKIRSIIEVELIDGHTLVEHADERYRGGPERPFTREELYEKWSDCAGLVLPPVAVEQVFEMLEGLEALDDVTVLVRALTAHSGTAHSAAAHSDTAHAGAPRASATPSGGTRPGEPE
jgi:2-methylcitrate dehydratase PrpD